MAPTKNQSIDLGWRALWTAVQSGTAVLLGAGVGLIDADVGAAAGVAALGGALSVAKSFAGQQLGQDAVTHTESRV